MNNICLVGRLTKDVEMKFTVSGIAVTTFNVAVDRAYAKEGQQTTDFIRIKTLGKLAEICGEYLVKGKLVSLTGSLNINNYEKDGEKKSLTEVLAQTMKMLDKKESQ